MICPNKTRFQVEIQNRFLVFWSNKNNIKDMNSKLMMALMKKREWQENEREREAHVAGIIPFISPQPLNTNGY